MSTLTTHATTPVPVLSDEELAHALAVRDLTDPAQGAHAIQRIVDAVVTELSRDHVPCVQLSRGRPVVPLADNYDALGYPADAVTREARYTRYADRDHVLRSHTSALVPPALRRIAAASRPAPDVLLVCPGITWRRDSIDWQHTGTPHQLDLWRVSRLPGARLDEAALEAMIGKVVSAALPGAAWRTVPSPHPYTTAGRQIDVLREGTWVEIGECGLAAEHVLRGAGLSGEWSGLAMGLGLDRLLMLRKGVPDIRLLRSADQRVADQMLDLQPYQPVSHLPAVRRDLSVAVAEESDVSEEAIGDRVRAALAADADVVESVSVLADTAYDDLPQVARGRLGMRVGQRNLLVRMALRPLDRTLTDADANLLRDRVYAELHEGAVHQWAAGEPPALVSRPGRGRP